MRPHKAQKPMFIIGQGALARADGAAVLALAAKAAAAIGVVKDDWNGFNILHTAAAASARSMSVRCRAMAA